MPNPSTAFCPSVTGKGRSINHTSKSKHRDYPLSLKVWIDIEVEDRTFPIRALIDTGAEVNIIKKGIIPQEYLQTDSNPLVLRGANEGKLKGGNLCIRGQGIMDGKTIEGQQPVRVQTSIHMYEAEISAQAILSYKWLADQNFLVHPRRHGLYFQDENVEVFIPGISEEGNRTQVARLDKVVAIRLQSVPMGLLDSKSSEPTQVTSSSKRAKGKERRTSTSPAPAQIESDDSGNSSDPIRGRSKVPDHSSSSSALRQKTPSPSRSRSPKTDTPVDGPPKTLRMLDLFSGTGSTPQFLEKRDMRW